MTDHEHKTEAAGGLSAVDRSVGRCQNAPMCGCAEAEQPCAARVFTRTTNDLLELMVEQDEEWCTCGALHDQDEIGGQCKSCGKLAD